MKSAARVRGFVVVLLLVACSDKANAPSAPSASTRTVVSAPRNTATLSSGTIDPVGQSSTGKLVLANNVPADILASGIDAVKIANGSVSSAEFQTLDGSNTGTTIQAQLDGKQSTLPLPLSVISGGTGTATGSITPTVDNSVSLGSASFRYASARALLLDSGANTLTLNSGVANSASAVGINLTTNTQFSTTGAKVFAVSSGGSGDLFKIERGSAGFASTYRTDIYPITDGAVSLGSASLRWGANLINPTFAGSFAGTYTIAGTPSLGANLIPSSNNVQVIGDPTHILSNVYTNKISTKTASGSGTAFNINNETTLTSTGKLVSFLNNTQELVSIGFQGIFGYLLASTSAIVSASTITPFQFITHITGTAAIDTITVPSIIQSANKGGVITLIPDGAWTWTTAGNIARAGTAIVNKSITFTYDANALLWYPNQ